jgi:hypothetical protein
MAAVALHHLTGEGDFAGLMGSGAWPAGEAVLTANEALFVGLLLLIAAAGKSALIPFSGWLPRAMEGPTGAWPCSSRYPIRGICYGQAFSLIRVFYHTQGNDLFE